VSRFALVVALVACNDHTPPKVDLALVRVLPDAQLRTDTLGDATSGVRATFVLVDAENASTTGAVVTLGGALRDAAGATVGTLGSRTLWMPAGGTRTFALIDDARAARPTATSARIEVQSATVQTTPPDAHVDDVREHNDDGQGREVVTGVVVNDADRSGAIMVIASFHGADHRPMTRPFELMRLGAHVRQNVQFVGPVGSKHGTIFIGEIVY
jgi:hypothetical protein